MANLPKHFTLLEAYRELTEKETACLKSKSVDATLEVQRKKARILRDLELLQTKSPLGEDLAARYKEELNALLSMESANADIIGATLDEDRDEYRQLMKQSGSASKVLRAYGATGRKSARRSLSGEA